MSLYLESPNFCVMAKVPELCLLMQGQKRRRANNILPTFCFQGLPKTCLIHGLHIQELRESILFCWGVHQGTFPSLVSERGVVSSHFQYFFWVGPLLMESIKWDTLGFDCTTFFFLILLSLHSWAKQEYLYTDW